MSKAFVHANPFGANRIDLENQRYWWMRTSYKIMSYINKVIHFNTQRYKMLSNQKTVPLHGIYLHLLAYAIFRVLQTKPLVKGELDPHVARCH